MRDSAFFVKFTTSNELSYNGNYYLELWKRRNKIRADLINCGDNYALNCRLKQEDCACAVRFSPAFWAYKIAMSVRADPR
jgi:hypothetical protein